MDWWQAIAVMATVVVCAVTATTWMHTQLRRQDEKIALLKEEVRSVRENLASQNRVNDVTLKALADRIDHKLGTPTQSRPPADGDLRP